jgi:beta-phosphoglucomutase-like phosphatase (HAD superfamily)
MHKGIEATPEERREQMLREQYKRIENLQKAIYIEEHERRMHGKHQDLEGRLKYVEQELQELRRLLNNHTDKTTTYSSLDEAIRSLNAANVKISDCSFSWDGNAWCIRGQFTPRSDT